MELTPTQIKFIELEKQKEEIKQYYKEFNETLKALIDEIGESGMFQDPTDKTVYQLTTPDGRFVTYDKHSYVRTKREGEARGSLSMVKAREAGFNV